MKSPTYDTLVAGFQTTRWELVTKAAETEGKEREQALEDLCRIYWPALYGYMRRQGFLPVDAQDLTQGFLFHLIKGTMLEEVRPEKGRFRSYLAVCCNHFVSNHRDAANTLKRGGGVHFLPLDYVTVEKEYETGLISPSSPEKEFTRKWIVVLLARVMKQLEQDYEEDGKGDIFDALHPILTGDSLAASYRELAGRMKTSEANIQVLAHRLRRKFADLLREEIKSTLADPSELNDELRYLIAALT